MRHRATASPARAPRGQEFEYYVAPGSTRASLSQLQALYVRDSRTPRPNHRMCKTEGPNILSASYGSVKGREAVRADRQRKGRFPGGKPPFFYKNVRTTRRRRRQRAASSESRRLGRGICRLL